MRYLIGGENIPTVKEEPVKSLHRWYKGTLRDSEQGKLLKKSVEKGLKAIKKTELPGKFKCWCLRYRLYPRIRWPLLMNQLQQPISCIVEEYKAAKVEMVMMLRFSNDSEIKENSL